MDSQQRLDAHVRAIIHHHFSPETGTPYWLRFAETCGWNPLTDIQRFADLERFGPFDKQRIKTAPHEDWTPRGLVDHPPHVFETGGTTGMPTQRLSWEDHLIDYRSYATSLPDSHFSPGGAWLIVGPTGPRRLRLTMEYLANQRGCLAYHVDLDPRWVRRCIANGDVDGAKAYQQHVIDQAVTLLKHRTVDAIFTTPRLLEAIGEAIDLTQTSVRAVLCGGTSMPPQTIRFLVEEILEEQILFIPVYGNTLMGLATAEPVGPHNGWEVVYHAPQPRAVLRVLGPDGRVVPYGSRGRVQLTTLTREFFMPNLLERDEATRRPPTETFPWDGVGDVRPWTDPNQTVIEGVY